MRCFVPFLVAMVALPVLADDGFSLGLEDMDFAAEPVAEASPGDLSDLTLSGDTAERAEVLAFQAALISSNPNERTMALWNSEMGRLHYALAAERSMLGREGLINGGRMAGVGLGTAGIGDGDPNGALGMALGRGKWAEMNANQKLQAGAEATILGALPAFMVSYAD